jgi:uncharacterized protein with HEPN domain
MPSREVKLYLLDIKKACDRITLYTKDITLNAFIKDEMRTDAVIRNIEMIGEAVKQLPDIITKKYPNIEWKKIAGLRDILIHHYFGINENIIWDVVKNKIPKLDKIIEEILKTKYE